MNGRKIMALVLAVAMIAGTAVTLVGALRSGKNSSYTSFQYSEGITADGYFKGVKAKESVSLPDYKSYTISKDLTVASEEDVEKALDEIVASFTTSEKDFDEEKVSAMGDKVNIDYVGSVDGVEFKGGNTNGNGTTITIGSSGYLGATEECAGFDEQLVGHKVGETFDITVQFPEGYSASEDADGNEIVMSERIAVFTITLNNFYKDIVPEITDEFVKENFSGKYSDVDDMKEKLAEEIVDDQIKSYVWTKLTEESEVTNLPKKVKSYHDDAELYAMASQLSYYGMTVDSYIEAVGFESVEEYLDYAGTTTRAEQAMLVQAVCEAEGITMTDDDVATYFEKFYGDSDIQPLVDSYGMNYLKKAFLSEKMLDTIIAEMDIVD